MGPATLAVTLSTIEIDYPSPTMPRLREVGGVTATVVGSPGPAVRWESAFGDNRWVAVDYKSIVLLDAERVDAYRLAREREDGDPTDLMVYLEREPFKNVGAAVVLTCGKGDGCYEVFLGYTVEDRLAEIVVDLELFDGRELV